MDQAIDHQELDACLKRSGSTWTAGQAHGLLCSRLAIAGQNGSAGWFQMLLGESDSDPEAMRACEALLDELYQTTWQQLVERQSAFVLLLPDDAESAEVRADAMGEWCQGFLHGLVAEKHGEALRAKLADEPLADIIKDMLEITRVTVDQDADAEEGEAAFVELVEYLRVAVQLVYEELAQFRRESDGELRNPAATVH